MPDPSPAERREWAEGLLRDAKADVLCDECGGLGIAWSGCGCGPGVMHIVDCGRRPPDCARCGGRGVIGGGRDRLIAAAPDLAAAVRDLADENERLRVALAEIALAAVDHRIESNDQAVQRIYEIARAALSIPQPQTEDQR